MLTVPFFLPEDSQNVEGEGAQDQIFEDEILPAVLHNN